MKKLVLGIFCLTWAFGVNAGGGNQRIGVFPNIITDQDIVRIGIADTLAPCIAVDDSITPFYHLSASNHITFVFVGIGYNPCINIPGFGVYFDTTTLPVGDYTLQAYVVSGPSSLPSNINDPLGAQFGDLVQFTVQGSQAVQVPTFGLVSSFVLILLMTSFAFWKLKRTCSLFAIVLLSTGVEAKTFILLISDEPGSPSPEQIISEASLSPPPGSYSLNTFNEYNPEVVSYYIWERPFGQRQNLINQYPDWTVSILYRYIVVSYDDGIETSDLLLSFANDIYIEKASDISRLEGTISSGATQNPIKESNFFFGNFIGDFISDLDISLAWELSEGMGYVGIIDTGIDTDHPAFRAFSDTGNYLGGNLLDGYYQLDLASGDFNVDEQEPYDTQGVASFEPCDLADGVDDDLAFSLIAGHGTHVSGIIAAKDTSFTGICKNCGFGMMKWTKYGACTQFFNPPTLQVIASTEAIGTYLNILSIGGGYGTVNWSGGLFEYNHNYTQIITNENFCQSIDNEPYCNSLEVFKQNNVLMVSSGGNNRVKLDFPALETQTVAVAGVDETGDFWNESPGPGGPYDFSDDSNCPYNLPTNECGSNISHPPINQKIDVVTQSKNVYSTFYPGGRWNDTVDCIDASDGVPNDGYGECTGTSVSSPQVAAIMQLFRSTNPLLPNGTYDPDKTTGLINILNASSSRSLSGQTVSDYLGYGIPSASIGLEKILGYSNGNLMKTRLTPMFSLHSSEANNSVYSPFPQMALAFLSQNGANYDSNNNAALVNEFPNFWHGPNVSFPAPRAEFYVFTTNNNPFVNLKNMVPLRRMEKTINGSNRNDTFAVNTTEIEAFKADGYNYAGIEGYIYPTCLSEPGCIPAYAQKLYRVEDNVNFNHTLEILPVNDPAPPNSTKLGYVYPNVDTDGDGLIDGQEHILGTSIFSQDSDGDGMLDSFEYPPAGVPFSDPLISDIIFEDGFE